MIEATKSDTNESRWRGKVTGEELRALLLEALRDELALPKYEPGFTLQAQLFVTEKPGELPAMSFEIVQDHHYWRKKGDEVVAA